MTSRNEAGFSYKSMKRKNSTEVVVKDLRYPSNCTRLGCLNFLRISSSCSKASIFLTSPLLNKICLTANKAVPRRGNVQLHTVPNMPFPSTSFGSNFSNSKSIAPAEFTEANSGSSSTDCITFSYLGPFDFLLLRNTITTRATMATPKRTQDEMIIFSIIFHSFELELSSSLLISAPWVMNPVPSANGNDQLCVSKLKKTIEPQFA
mmetsp:Transcript_4426/g.6199  ORF Transcript_4426/g.6199 Transcript_4426/m.6199 type:complete len:206 (-) Transcript_4426:675-1292(-)